MSWLDKLYLPPFSQLPTMLLISVLNRWYGKRQVFYPDDDETGGVIVGWDELQLLRFLKMYAQHSIIAGSSAYDILYKKSGFPYIDVFIPVYGRLEEILEPTLSKMFEKAKGQNYASYPGTWIIHDLHRSLSCVGYTNTMKDQSVDYCNYGEDTYAKFVRIRYFGVVMHWIEIQVDDEDIFVQELQPEVLFVFYLLSTFDIVKHRLAITDWHCKSVAKITDFPHIITADECVDLVYSFPGYPGHMLQSIGKIYHTRGKKLGKKLNKQGFYSCVKYRKCLKYSKINWMCEFADHTFFNITLERLCLAVLVSLSDFCWVKFKRHFHAIPYCTLQKCRDKILG